MGTLKEELQGILSVSFEVKAGLGTLAPLTPIRLTGINPYEIEPFVGPGQPDFMPHIGYVMISNSKPNNDSRVVVATRDRAVQKLVAGEPLLIGKPVTYDTAGKVIAATFRQAQSGFKVFDNVWDGGETITIETFVLTEGVDFVTGPDIPTTAQNIANAIDSNVPGYRGRHEDVDKVLVMREDDGPNFNNSAIFIATSDDGADIAVDPALAQDGDISILDPYGITLTRAGGVDELVDVLVF